VFSDLGAQSKNSVDSLIQLNKESYEQLSNIITQDDEVIALWKSKMVKFLHNKKIQQSILLIEDGNTKEPDTKIYTFNIEKRIAAMFILSAIYLKELRFAHKFEIYDYEKEIEIDMQNVRFRKLVRKMKKWAKGKTEEFSLQKGKIFWKRNEYSAKDIYRKLGR
jgi:hypothetical protein